MTTRVILDVEAGLSPEEIGHLRQLLYDALGEFVSARGGVSGDNPSDALRDALGYIKKRYPNFSRAEQQRKVEEVILRKAIARKLRAGASDVRAENLLPIDEETDREVGHALRDHLANQPSRKL